MIYYRVCGSKDNENKTLIVHFKTNGQKNPKYYLQDVNDRFVDIYQLKSV